MNKKVKVYVCGVDWDYEMGECILHVYPSVKSLKKKRTCWKQCGIVQLEVRQSRIIKKQMDWSKLGKVKKNGKNS